MKKYVVQVLVSGTDVFSTLDPFSDLKVAETIFSEIALENIRADISSGMELRDSDLKTIRELQ
jgi:hypothetical protein